MKHILFFAMLSFAGIVLAEPNSCASKVEQYWAPKLTQYSTILGKLIAEQGQRSVALNAPEFLKWKMSILESAQEMDRLFFNSGSDSFLSVTKAMLNKIQEHGQLPNTAQAFPHLVFNVSDDFDSLDRVDLRGVSRKSIDVDTHSNIALCEAKVQCSASLQGENVCQQYVDFWAKGITAYKNPTYQLVPKKMSALAIEYGADWDRFFDKARSQTLFDHLLTARMNKKSLVSKEFNKAPDIQYFLAHPGVVMEYMGDAEDGEQFDTALAVEWFGMNWWRGCNLGFTRFPCGVSAISVYSDKSSAEDLGHGLMFHVNNAYSFGFTRRNSGNGFFITADVLKAFESNLDKLEKWQVKASQYLQ